VHPDWVCAWKAAGVCGRFAERAQATSAFDLWIPVVLSYDSILAPPADPLGIGCFANFPESRQNKGESNVSVTSGFVRTILTNYPKTFASIAFLTVTSLIPALGLVIILAQAIRQLQAPPENMLWTDLVGHQVANWLGPLLRGTQLETGISAEIQITALPLALACIGLAHAVIKGTSEYLIERLSEDVARTARTNVMHSFFERSFFDATTVDGSLVASLVGNDSQELKTGVRRLLGLMPINALQSAALLAWLIILDAKLFILFLAVLIPAAVVLRILGKTLKRLARQGIKKQTEVLELFVERLRGWETIRVFNSLSFELAKFRKQNLDLYQGLRRSARAASLGAPLVEWLATVAGAIVVLIALRRLAIGELSSSVLTCFLVTIGHLSGTLQSLTRHLANMKRSRAAIERIQNFIQAAPAKPAQRSLPPNLKEANQEQSLPVKIETVALKNVTVSESGGTRVLSTGLSINLKNGDFCAIVGPSGSGKSTLLRCLTGLEAPLAGEIMINGKQANEPEWLSLSRDLSFIAQEPFILHGTLLENIVFPDSPDKSSEIYAKTCEHAMACLKRAKLSKELDDFGSDLSGGEKQRLMLARAFYRNASLWILDEATSALDTATEEGFLTTIKENSQEHIVIFVTHRQSVASYATHTIDLRKH
jgi:subfamily B ATP-binding cassette protein MsbA